MSLVVAPPNRFSHDDVHALPLDPNQSTRGIGPMRGHEDFSGILKKTG